MFEGAGFRGCSGQVARRLDVSLGCNTVREYVIDRAEKVDIFLLYWYFTLIQSYFKGSVYNQHINMNAE